MTRLLLAGLPLESLRTLQQAAAKLSVQTSDAIPDLSGISRVGRIDIIKEIPVQRSKQKFGRAPKFLPKGRRR